MSMIHRQSTRSLVFLQAEWIPMLADRLHIDIDPLSQVPRGRLEVLSNDVVVEVTQ